MRAWQLLPLVVVVALAAGCSSAATETEHGSARAFETAGRLAASSTYVVRGRITEVERGPTVKYQDGSGTEITPRLLVVEVEHYLFTRDRASATPATLRVQDGYWENGHGYQLQGLEWAQPGDAGVFFLSRDRAPDGSVLSTFTPLSSEGRVLFDPGHAEYDAGVGSVWASLGQNASPEVLHEAIADAVEQAKSGAARPVPVTICYPSDPDDENSEPICERE